MPVYFWLGLALMAVLAVAIALWPLWRGRSAPAADRVALNRQIYRERIAELQEEQAAGRLSADEVKLQENDLGRRLLAEAEVPDRPAAKPRRAKPWLVSLLVIAALPAAAFAVYLEQASWRLASDEGPDMAYLVERMHERVQSSPDDVQAWILLAQARESLGRYQEAASAYAEATARMQPPQARFLVREAELRALVAEGDLSGRPTILFERALGLDPDHPKALWYAGLAARRRGDNQAAADYWQRLNQQKVPPEIRRLLERQLENLREGSDGP